MLEALQSQFILVVGALLVLVLIGARAASRGDVPFRRDLSGALVLLTAFLVLRVIAWALPADAPSGLVKLVAVAWMLSFAWGCIRAFVSIALKALRWRRATVTPKILRDVIDITLYFLSAIPILKSQLNIDVGGLIATSAILSVVIGLALQDTLGNLFAGLSLQLEQPYQVGDWVTIGEYTGRVVQIAWRATRIETFRREIITLPNNLVAKEAVRNYRGGPDPVGVDLYVRISYETPPNFVQRVLRDVLEGINGVLQDPPPLVRAWEYDENAVRYQVRYFIDNYAFMDPVKGEFYQQLWYRLQREKIELPLPHRVLTYKEPANNNELQGTARRELLDTVDLFAPLGEKERDQLQGEALLRRFGRGEQIIEQGEEGHTFYVVMEGVVSVRSHGNEVTRLTRGAYFGEMSLLTGEPRSATVVAVDDALLLEFARPTFRRLFAEHPGLAKSLSQHLAERRMQLERLAVNSPAPSHDPEAHDIFSRLRQIFALKD